MIHDYKIKDSGEHREFNTGAKRDKKSGKGRFDLLPPFAMRRLAVHFQNGANKYEARNWEKGMDTWEYVDSSLRHIFDYLSGESTEDHLIAAAWNLMCCVDTQERIEKGFLPKELDTLKEMLHSTFKKDIVVPCSISYTTSDVNKAFNKNYTLEV